jgi:sigma-E factor negative regulatory protein RseC
MIEISATVISLDGGHAFVRVVREGCGRCHEPGGCGGKNPAQAFCLSPRTYRVINARGARVGEEVKVVIHERTLLHSAIAGYGFPLSTLFLGAGLGQMLAGETGSMIGAACGLAVAWAAQKVRRVRNVLPGSDSEPRIS